MTSSNIPVQEKLNILTTELIIAKADADFEPSPEKHEYIESLQCQIMDLLK